jgi:hypothetical protein
VVRRNLAAIPLAFGNPASKYLSAAARARCLEGLVVMKMQADGMLNQDEAARFLHVQPRTLESWRQRRIGPRFVRYSMRCVRYRAQDLQAWLDSQSIDTGSLGRE